MKPLFGIISFSMPFVGVLGAGFGRALDGSIGTILTVLFMSGTPLIGVAAGIKGCIRAERHVVLAAVGMGLSALWGVFALTFFLA